ncbi:MAG: pseudouridine synthase [Moraxellaceae bacterium]|nr:MAG: pseudouridine synthase [Moraxellaceae bacterium]
MENGNVTIHGEVCSNPKANFEIQRSDEQPLEFTVAGKSWQYREKVYLALNKPQGYECSHQPQHHSSVFSLLPAQLIERSIQCVGRLDQDTTGLLILTDDGAFLQALTHPKKHVAKRYLVTTNRPISDEQIEQLKQGVVLRNEQGIYKADDCLQLSENQLVLTIHQGLYHQVKRMIAAVGNHVDALHREQIGQFKLPDDLEEDEWIYLNDEQINQARQLV